VNLVRIPADVDREDALLAGLSARQLAVVGAATVLLWCAYAAMHTLVPLPLFAVLAAAVGILAVALAIGRMDGVNADVLARAALRQWLSPRRLVAASDEVPQVPAWLGVTPPFHPSPLHVPVERISPEGVIDLGSDGVAVVCRAPSLTISLRTDEEQEALMSAFGRFLNGLAVGLHVVIRSERVDLTHAAAELERRAARLQHPDVEKAAREHAEYLRSLNRRDAFRRAVFLVICETAGTDADARVLRRADEARSALAASGITLAMLDGRGVVRALTGAWARSDAGAATHPGLDV
jgi:hypothetical protein